MGNDSKTKAWHLQLYKFFSRYLYPSIYKFRNEDYFSFDLGYGYGKRLKVKVNLINFSQYQNVDISLLRRNLGIREKSLLKLKLIEEEKKRKYLLRSKKKDKRNKHSNFLKIFSAVFCLFGGLLLSSNTVNSGYGFVFLAVSSGTMLVASVAEFDKIMIFYSTMLFCGVDLRGIYFWLIVQ